MCQVGEECDNLVPIQTAKVALYEVYPDQMQSDEESQSSLETGADGLRLDCSHTAVESHHKQNYSYSRFQQDRQNRAQRGPGYVLDRGLLAHRGGPYRSFRSLLVARSAQDLGGEDTLSETPVSCCTHSCRSLADLGSPASSAANVGGESSLVWWASIEHLFLCRWKEAWIL